MKKTRTRVRRSPEQWRKIIEEFEASGIDRKGFCETRGLRVESLRRAELRLAGPEVLATPFIELSPPAFAERVSNRRWDIELELGEGLVLRLASH